MLTWLPAAIALWLAFDLLVVLALGVGGKPPRPRRTRRQPLVQ